MKVVRAVHASPTKFSKFDWSRLGHTTKAQLEGAPEEKFAMNLAKIGPWAHDKDISPHLPTKHHAHPVELSGKQANFNSLRSLEKAVRDAGGPERFRHAMVGNGYGHIAVNDEEFRGKSYIGLKPDTFAVKNSRANGGSVVDRALMLTSKKASSQRGRP
jgi:hypothetical protein